MKGDGHLGCRRRRRPEQRLHDVFDLLVQRGALLYFTALDLGECLQKVVLGGLGVRRNLLAYGSTIAGLSRVPIIGPEI
jgi:hypothetical protein